jgi:hypothetical protein
MADRRSVSLDAHKVWMYYMQHRPDVKIHQLDTLDTPHLTGIPDDDCEQASAHTHTTGHWASAPESKRITKDNTTTLRALALDDKLVMSKGLSSKLKIVLVPAG